jgi:hypothetical protein
MRSITAVMLVGWPRSWWMVGAAAYRWFTQGRASFRTQLEREAVASLSRSSDAPLVTEVDLARLPDPVRRYLRAADVIGQPRVRSYHVRFRGRIRSAPDARWMPFEAEQHSFVDPPARLFLMRARMMGVPVQAFHRLVNGHARMQVKIGGVIPIVDAQGDVMDRSEAVTLLNDMCILAPATLLDRAITWDAVDERTVRVRFTNGAHTVSAVLSFDGDGRLANFVSDDRSRASSDGKVFTRLRFSTPVRDYRDFGAARLAAHGEARWLLPAGEFTYGEFDVEEVTYNVPRHRVR